MVDSDGERDLMANSNGESSEESDGGKSSKSLTLISNGWLAVLNQRLDCAAAAARSTAFRLFAGPFAVCAGAYMCQFAERRTQTDSVCC